MGKTLFELEKQSWSKAKENCFKFLEFAQENFWLSGKTEENNFDSRQIYENFRAASKFLLSGKIRIPTISIYPDCFLDTCIPNGHTHAP